MVDMDKKYYLAAMSASHGQIRNLRAQIERSPRSIADDEGRKNAVATWENMIHDCVNAIAENKRDARDAGATASEVNAADS